MMVDLESWQKILNKRILKIYLEQVLEFKYRGTRIVMMI